MTAVTTEQLGATVGVQVAGVDPERLLEDEALPAWLLDTLDTHGVLVFRDLHLDDATQVAFSKRLGRVEVFGKGVHPEIFRITLDPAKNPMAAYLRGTFDWHIDGCTDDVPIMATILSAHAVAESGGETEFASTYTAFDDLTRRGEGALPVPPGRALLRGGAADDQRRPVTRGARPVADATVEGAPAGLDARVGAPLPGARRDDVARGRAWTSRRGGRCWPTCWRDRPRPSASTATNGRSVTW